MSKPKIGFKKMPKNKTELDLSNLQKKIEKNIKKSVPIDEDLKEMKQ